MSGESCIRPHFPPSWKWVFESAEEKKVELKVINTAVWDFQIPGIRGNYEVLVKTYDPKAIEDGKEVTICGPYRNGFILKSTPHGQKLTQIESILLEAQIQQFYFPNAKSEMFDLPKREEYGVAVSEKPEVLAGKFRDEFGGEMIETTKYGGVKKKLNPGSFLWKAPQGFLYGVFGIVPYKQGSYMTEVDLSHDAYLGKLENPSDFVPFFELPERLKKVDLKVF